MAIVRINTTCNPFYIDVTPGIQTYATFILLPSATDNQGVLAIAGDMLFIANNGAWWPMVRVS